MRSKLCRGQRLLREGGPARRRLSGSCAALSCWSVPPLPPTAPPPPPPPPPPRPSGPAPPRTACRTPAPTPPRSTSRCSPPPDAGVRAAERSAAFVTETRTCCAESTAPWGRLPLRVDVLRVRGPNATEELAPAPPPTPTPTPVTSTEANAATTPVTRAADVTTGATTRELPATAAAEAEDDEEQEREAAITTPGTTTASATPDTNTIPVDVDYATDESINLV
ncbi:Protein of unknown function [Gryllus bimaculatus]|nr:Protein of unknown function [Gryllus bimaculatus]